MPSICLLTVFIKSTISPSGVPKDINLLNMKLDLFVTLSKLFFSRSNILYIVLYPGYTGVRELLQRRYRKIRGETPPGIFNLVYMPHCCRACSIFHQDKSRMNSKVCMYLVLIPKWCIANVVLYQYYRQMTDKNKLQAIAHTMKI